MKRTLPITIILLLAPLMLGLVPSSEERTFHVSYTIEPQSNLYIKGTTNINSFECVSLDAFRVQELQGTFYPSSRKVSFKGATLQLQVKKLDCKNSKMNKDLCEAMNADIYPTIKVHLHSASLKAPGLSQSAAEIIADATLEITGVRKKVQFNTRGVQLSDDAYEFISEQTIKMTDFGVEPPTALFGLIKVDDEITIHLDIVTRTVVKEN